MLLFAQVKSCATMLVAIAGDVFISWRDAVQCLHEDGKSEHRVCIFKDVVLWEGQLLYIAKGGFLAAICQLHCSPSSHKCPGSALALAQMYGRVYRQD